MSNLDNKVVRTTVTHVEWVTHGTGKLFPTVHYEPVEISRCTATKASGKSYAFIRDNNITKGTQINLVRSGEVIPNIYSVVKEESEKNALLDVIREIEVWDDYRQEIPIDIKCQYGCDPELLHVDGVHLYCRNPNCPALMRTIFERLLDTFAPKLFSDAMRTAVMSAFDNNVFKMLEFYKINKNINLYSLGIEGLTEHGANLILQLLQEMTEWKLRLYQLVDIAVVEYFGDMQAKVIESKASSNKELTEWAINNSVIESDLIINVRAGQNWTRRHPSIKRLLGYFILIVPKKKEINAYKDYVYIAGKMEKGSKKSFADVYVTPYGYKWVETLTEATVLINADGKISGKVKTARKRKIKIIPIEEWITERNKEIIDTDS